MSKKPWMKFYWNEFYADTATFTAAQTGIYICLIGLLWKSTDGTVPFHEADLARAARCDRHNWVRAAPAVMAKFKVTEDGKFFHDRVLEERGKARLHRVLIVPGALCQVHSADNYLKSFNTAVRHRSESSDKIRSQSLDSKSSGNISAAPLSARDHVSAPIIPSTPLSLPRARSKTASRKRALKNGARPKGRAIFDRTTEGSELDGIPDRLMTDFIRKAGH